MRDTPKNKEGVNYMFALTMFVLSLIGIAVEIGWGKCNWGYLLAIGVFFGAAFLAYVTG